MIADDVSSFWTWFAEQSAVLSFLCSHGEMAQARSVVDEQLSKLGSGLRWEIVAGYREKFRLTITQRRNDDPALRLLGKAIMAASPDHMQGWEFCLMVLGAPEEREARPAAPATGAGESLPSASNPESSAGEPA